MKSEQAEVLLNAAKQVNVNGCPVALGVAIRAVEIAEQGAEERMKMHMLMLADAHQHDIELLKEKAVEAFCFSMESGDTGCDRRKPFGCTRKCNAAKIFINKLNE